MAQTPKTIKVDAVLDFEPVKEAIQFAGEQGDKQGYERGLKEILDWLQWAYIDDEGRPDRGTPKAEAILEIAGRAEKHIQKLMKGQK